MAPRGNEVTNDQFIEEFNTAVAEVEQLLQSMPDAGAEKSAALRARLASIAVNLLGRPTSPLPSVRERTDRVGTEL